MLVDAIIVGTLALATGIEIGVIWNWVEESAKRKISKK
jgi:hypothetical protein